MYRGKHDKITWSNSEQLSTKQKIARFGGGLAMAAAAIVPVADYAAADAIGAKVYNIAESEAHFDSKTANTVTVDALVGLGLAAECVALSTVFTRSKKFAGIKNDFEGYIAEREETMSKPRKILSKTVNAPYAGIIKLGGAFEKMGEKVETSTDSSIGQAVGHLIVDTGKVNAMGPPMAAMQEAINGRVPSLKRNAYYGGLFAASWIGLAEGIKEVYRNVAPLRPPMAFVGETFQTLTSFDNPLGATALTAAGVGLAVTGWRVAEFHREKASQEDYQAPEVSNELVPFPETYSVQVKY